MRPSVEIAIKRANDYHTRIRQRALKALGGTPPDKDSAASSVGATGDNAAPSVSTPGSTQATAPADTNGTRPGQEPVSADRYEWARQAELVRAINQVLGEGILHKGGLSRKCTDRKIETNGKSGRASRVRVSSFLAWAGRQFEIAKEEQDQVRNAIIGEIMSRKS